MRLILAALVALAGSGPVSAQARAPVEPPDSADTAPTFLDDVELGARLVARGFAAPLRWTPTQWLTIPAAAVVLGVVTTVDGDVEHFAETHQGPVGDGWFGTVEPFGTDYAVAVVVGVYAGGWVLGRTAWRRTAVEAAASSVLAAGVITPTLKLLFGRVRPREERGPYEFHPLSGNSSFPSGHSTGAFAVASVIAAESESWVVDVLAYGLATSVAGARIYHDAHFLSDVLAGAAIGTAVGHGVVRGGRAYRGSAEPFIGAVGDGVGIGVRMAVGPGG